MYGRRPLVPITVPVVSFDDGLSGAPTGTAQHPTWLQAANGGGNYVKVPTWNVPGVNYRTGINTGVTLKDPTAGGLPAGASLSSRKLTISQDSVTLDGWDFTVSTGIQIDWGSHVGGVLRNCKMAYSATLASPCINNMVNGTIEYCDIDGTNIDTTVFSQIVNGKVLSGGIFLVRYNWIRNSGEDLIEADVSSGSGTLVEKFNVFENSGIKPPVAYSPHPDFFQMVTGPLALTIINNACFNNISANGTGGVFSQGYYLANGVFGNVLIDHNVFRSSPGATPTGHDVNGAGLQMHSWVSGVPNAGSSLQSGATININNNYCDPTDCSGFAYNRTNASFSGNVNMLDGSSFDVSG